MPGPGSPFGVGHHPEVHDVKGPTCRVEANGDWTLQASVTKHGCRAILRTVVDREILHGAVCRIDPDHFVSDRVEQFAADGAFISNQRHEDMARIPELRVAGDIQSTSPGMHSKSGKRARRIVRMPG